MTEPAQLPSSGYPSLSELASSDADFAQLVQPPPHDTPLHLAHVYPLINNLVNVQKMSATMARQRAFEQAQSRIGALMEQVRTVTTNVAKVIERMQSPLYGSTITCTTIVTPELSPDERTRYIWCKRPCYTAQDAIMVFLNNQQADCKIMHAVLQAAINQAHAAGFNASLTICQDATYQVRKSWIPSFTYAEYFGRKGEPITFDLCITRPDYQPVVPAIPKFERNAWSLVSDVWYHPWTNKTIAFALGFLPTALWTMAAYCNYRNAWVGDSKSALARLWSYREQMSNTAAVFVGWLDLGNAALNAAYALHILESPNAVYAKDALVSSLISSFVGGAILASLGEYWHDYARKKRFGHI